MLIEKNNFITYEDCDEIIRISEDRLVEAQVVGGEKGYRIASYTWIDNNEPISVKLKNITSIETGLPIDNMENINIVKYEVGGEYKTHCDFFEPSVSYQSEMERGGQRVKSVLFYLNDYFEGGQTDFPTLNIRVEPVKSKVIIWDNLKVDGSLDYDTLHAGLPVTSGTKYIATIWIRENAFGFIKENTELNYYDSLGL
jgi:prolyl 4-hydroxylase